MGSNIIDVKVTQKSDGRVFCTTINEFNQAVASAKKDHPGARIELVAEVPIDSTHCSDADERHPVSAYDRNHNHRLDFAELWRYLKSGGCIKDIHLQLRASPVAGQKVDDAVASSANTGLDALIRDKMKNHETLYLKDIRNYYTQAIGGAASKNFKNYDEFKVFMLGMLSSKDDKTLTPIEERIPDLDKKLRAAYDEYVKNGTKFNAAGVVKPETFAAIFLDVAYGRHNVYDKLSQKNSAKNSIRYFDKDLLAELNSDLSPEGKTFRKALADQKDPSVSTKTVAIRFDTDGNANDLSFNDFKKTPIDFLKENLQYRIAYPHFSGGDLTKAELAKYGVTADKFDKYDTDKDGQLSPYELLRYLANENAKLDVKALAGKSIVFEFNKETVHGKDYTKAPLLDEIIAYYAAQPKDSSESAQQLKLKDFEDFFGVVAQIEGDKEGKPVKTGKELAREFANEEEFENFVKNDCFSKMPGITVSIDKRIPEFHQKLAVGYKKYIAKDEKSSGRLTETDFAKFIVELCLGEEKLSELKGEQKYFTAEQIAKLNAIFNPAGKTFDEGAAA